ncbi:MAG: NAD(P)/FAD-dependent oxidoreductase [Cytophagales bacterium]|nr:MAG: NAD(P)/FAD-dependent oxidoreductase [Cytophagales bacterium]
MLANIPQSNKKRIVVVGAGFGGLKLARSLVNSNYQIILLDKNNYHQFQPLFYQVATAGLEPSAISFPLRKVFQKFTNIHIRIAEVKSVNTEFNHIETDLGTINYDYLVLALGCNTNYFGMQNISKYSIPMKSVSEALYLRNFILQNLEKALEEKNPEEKQKLMTIVIAGGGPTGVEIAGTLAEMKKNILPKDYPELDFSKMLIYLLEGSAKTLGVMSEISSKKSREYLDKLGVIVKTETRVLDFDGEKVLTDILEPIQSKTLIWAAGVSPNKIEGLAPEWFVRGNRLKVDAFNKIEGSKNIFAIGDMASQSEEKFPNGHPQLAQPAMQQADNLAKNFKGMLENKSLKPFKYNDLGSMATVGRNLAVVELPFIKFQGFLAWATWMFVHLMSIVGVKNRLLIFVNWCWNYFTYDQSLRLLIKPKIKNEF